MKKNIICIFSTILLMALFTECAALPLFKSTPDTSEVKTLQLKKDVALQKKDTNAAATAYQDLGLYYFWHSNDSALAMIDSARFFFYQIKKLADYATCLQNMAFVYDELKKDTMKAIEYAESSLKVWSQLDAPLKVANMDKYLGMLYGKVKKYDKAKQVIAEAIQKFDAGKYAPGVAVSQYDLATVYENQGMPDSAVYYVNVATQYWSTIHDTLRIFGMNSYLLLLFLKQSDLVNAKKYFEENKKLESFKGLYWKQLTDFYSNSIQLLRKLNDSSALEEYTRKYETKKAELAKDGVKVD